MVEGKDEPAGHTYKWPRPALTVDIAIVAHAPPAPPKLLLIKRKHPPCMGQWALPGGFVDELEPLQEAAARELKEETGVDASGLPLVQVGTFGDPGRDPRGWTVTVCYGVIIPKQVSATAADDAADAQWCDVLALPPLAFDHQLVLRQAFSRLAELGAGDGGAFDPGVEETLLKAAQQLEGPWTPPVE